MNGLVAGGGENPLASVGEVTPGAKSTSRDGGLSCTRNPPVGRCLVCCEATQQGSEGPD